MVGVEIRTPIYDEESHQFTWRGCAFIRAEGDTLDIIGDASLVDPDLPIVDASTGRQLRGTDNPEAWARNLPYAYRSGDLLAVVAIDTDGRSEAGPVEHEIPAIPSPPEVTRLVESASAA